MKKIGIVILALALVLLGLGCEKENSGPVDHVNEEDTLENGNLASEDQGLEEGPKIVVDALGRQVEIPEQPERFVNVGVGSLRLYTYVAPIEKLVGVEQVELEPQAGVPYSMVNSEALKELPIIGQGGPKNPADPEAIVSVEPDVIFDNYSKDPSEADDLQAKTGVPVVVVDYGETDVFDPVLYDSLLLIGELTGSQERAEEVVQMIQDYETDLTNRVKDIGEEDQAEVYVGALGHRGAQGIESTRGDYILTDVINVKNVADQTGETGSFFIDKEQLLEWDPPYIFIDAAGLELVEADYGDNPEFYKSLTAVQGNQVYTQLPYKLRTTNVGTAIADMYFMGSVVYPEAFTDIDPEAKADEIYVNFLGQTCYQQMAADYEPFGKIDLNQE